MSRAGVPSRVDLSNASGEILEVDVLVALDEAARVFCAADLRNLGVAQKSQDGLASDGVSLFRVRGHGVAPAVANTIRHPGRKSLCTERRADRADLIEGARCAPVEPLPQTPLFGLSRGQWEAGKRSSQFRFTTCTPQSPLDKNSLSLVGVVCRAIELIDQPWVRTN